MFDIGIVTINYNSSSFTLDCIRSILKETNPNIKIQIIIVDNASSQEDYANLNQGITSLNASNIQIIRSKINTGFGAGNMLGTQCIDAKYIAFINNDSILQNDCLSILTDFLEGTPEAGICGPKAYNESGKLLPTLDHFSSLGKTVLKRKILEFINPSKYVDRKKDFSNPTRGQFVAGSFMVMRTEDFSNVGGFDTNIFLYHEETDICKRLLRLGKYAYLVPDAVFTHFHGVSTSKTIAIKQELKLSLLYVVRKHYGYLHYAILLSYLILTYFFKSIFKPKYWSMFITLVKGGSLAYSLRHKQIILP